MPRGMTSEASLIGRIRKVFGGLVAPGAYEFVDDAAMIPPVVGHRARVITTDMVVEGVDFDRALYPLAYAGFRALAQNLSDVAAMGAVPVGFVWSLAVPPSFSDDDVEEFARGAAILAKIRRVPIYGGDFSSTPGPMVCAVTAFGDVEGVPVRRSGARPGDEVWLSGPVGASAAGLRLLGGRALEQGGGPVDTDAFESWLRALPDDAAACVRAHVRPVPGDGAPLAGVATACIDVSDGLALDAARLAQASGVRLDLDEVPVAPGATHDEAWHGGEDFKLLVTAPPRQRIEDAVRVGVVAAGAGVTEKGARVEPRGWDHFSSR